MGKRSRSQRDASQEQKADPIVAAIDVAKIAARAYAMYLERQRAGTAGDDLSDWYAAERELRTGALERG